MEKRFVSLLLTLMMVIGMLPAGNQRVEAEETMQWYVGDSIDLGGYHVFLENTGTSTAECQSYQTIVPQPIFDTYINRWTFGSIILTAGASEPSQLIMDHPAGRESSETPTGFRVSYGDGSESSPFIFELIYDIPDVTEVILNKTSINLVQGNTETLTAETKPLMADKTITWASSDEAVAAVNDEGVVTAVGEGTTEVIATASNGTEDINDDVIASCTVNVGAAYPLWVGTTQATSLNTENILEDENVSASYDVQSNTLTLNGVDIKTGYTNDFGTFAIYYEGEDKLNVILSSGSENIIGDKESDSALFEAAINSENSDVSISGDGTLSAYSSKYGIIGENITIDGGVVNAKGGEEGCGIKADSITINDGKLTAAGNKQAISGNVINAIEGTGWADIEGTSEKTDIAISTEGQTLEFKKVQFPEEVITVTDISLDKTSYTMHTGEKLCLNAVLTSEDAADKTVKWSISGENADALKLYADEDCVNEVGPDATSLLTVYVMALSEGQAAVTVTANSNAEVFRTCEVTIEALDTGSKAYAVFKEDGDLVFARSKNTYENGSITTLVDIFDNEISGIVYADFETPADGFTVVPWTSLASEIKNVYVAQGQVISPVSMEGWFDSCSQLVSFNGDGFDLKNTGSVNGLFAYCEKLKEVSISWTDTDVLQRTDNMFYHCSSLEKLDLSGFDTSHVTSMMGMFNGCSSLTELKLGDFNTSNNMIFGGMFSGCSSLTTLDLSSFDTANATEMRSVFSGCTSLTEVKLGQGWSKWINESYLPKGTWTNGELSKSETELYEEYPAHANEWAGVWKKSAFDYSIQYVLNGGVNNEENIAGYNKGEKFVFHPASKEGYKFAGWYSKDGTESGKWGTQIKSITAASEGDLLLHAKWTPVKYTIKYVLNGASNAKTNKTSYTKEADLVFADPVKKGYTFTGWTDQYSEPITGTENYFENLVLTAQFVINDYKLELDPKGGSLKEKQSYDARLSLNEETQKYEAIYQVTSAAFKLPTLVKDHYRFNGWHRDIWNEKKQDFVATKVSAVAKGSAEDISLYASFTPIDHKITYNLNKGSIPKGSVYDKKFNVETQEITFAQPVRKGYVFDGWYLDKTLSVPVSSIEDLQLKDSVLYAGWKPITYTIHFEKDNRNAYGTMEDVTVKYDEKITLPENLFVRDGISFSKWTGNINGKITTYADKAKVSNLTAVDGDVVILKATWKYPKDQVFSIKYNLNKGTNTGNPASYNIDTEAFSLNDPTRKGYTFEGWYEAKDFSGEKVETIDPEIQTKNYVLYAKWESITYTIQYKSDQYASEIIEVRYDQTYKLSATALNAPGRKAQKYTYEIDGTAKTVSATASIKNLRSEQSDDPIIFNVAKDKNGNELWTFVSPDGKTLSLTDRLGEKVYTYKGVQIPAGLGAPVLTDAQIDELISIVEAERSKKLEDVNIEALNQVKEKITTLADAVAYLKKSKFAFTTKEVVSEAGISGPDVGNIGFWGYQDIYEVNIFSHTISGAQSLLLNEGQCSSMTSMMAYLLADDYEEFGYIKLSNEPRNSSEEYGGHAMAYIRNNGKYYLVNPASYGGAMDKLWLNSYQSKKGSSDSIEELAKELYDSRFSYCTLSKVLCFTYDETFCVGSRNGYQNDPGVPLTLPTGAEVKAAVNCEYTFEDPIHIITQETLLPITQK